MSSIADPGELTQSPPPSFDEFQRQTSLMTSCTLLWKELSDHFTSLEKDLQLKSEAIKSKIDKLDSETSLSLKHLETRELSLVKSMSLAFETVEKRKSAAMSLDDDDKDGDDVAVVDDSEGLLMRLRRFCTKMDSLGFWRFITTRKKELDSIRSKIAIALADCIDPARFVLEAISEVFPEDKRENKSERLNDLGWACVMVLESLIPNVVDPILGDSRLFVTPKVKENAREIAETWKASLEQRGGIENVKTPDVHTFLQHLVTFGIVKNEDFDLYWKLVVGSSWRKQMPKLAVSLGLGHKMPDMIKELISRGQQVDAVHFTYEVGLVNKFPPVPLLKTFLSDAKKAAASILEDPNNSGRAALAARKEQSALRAVVKCIEEYKLEAEFPPESLKKRLEQLEKVKTEKKRPAAQPANKRTRTNNGGPMPPAKAGRLTNAYVSSFPATPTFVRSPSHTQYPATGVPQYQVASPVYGHDSRSPPASHYVYSPGAASPLASPPLAASYQGVPMSYPAYATYGNGMAPWKGTKTPPSSSQSKPDPHTQHKPEVPGMNGAVEVTRPAPVSGITIFEFGSVTDKVTLAGYCPISDDLEPCRWEILQASDSEAPQFRIVF